MEDGVLASGGALRGLATSSTTSKERDVGGAVEGRGRTGKAVGRWSGRPLLGEEAVGGSCTEDGHLASGGAVRGLASSSTTSKEMDVDGPVEG
jgi:hypothetical protein